MQPTHALLAKQLRLTPAPPFCAASHSWAYAQSGWSTIAGLAPLVFVARDAGDATAQSIVRGGRATTRSLWPARLPAYVLTMLGAARAADAVAALVQSVQAVADQLSLGTDGQPFPIVLSGEARHVLRTSKPPYQSPLISCVRPKCDHPLHCVAQGVPWGRAHHCCRLCKRRSRHRHGRQSSSSPSSTDRRPALLEAKHQFLVN